ncbi:MAG: flagellar brake protein [Lachnospiraceae bacterium]|nr:flagellar brake protein [Lachnospiraceae bacterium]
MISKYVTVGDRIDIESIKATGADATEKKLYRSQVFDIESEDRIKVAMPMEQGRVILLPVDEEFNLCFYTPSGLYQCLGRVAERYKSNNIFVLVMELTTDIRKYQRREYYRLNCVLDMKSTMINQNDVSSFSEKVHFIDTDLTFDNGTMVDISGGGARFISRVKYPKDSNILFTFDLFVNDALTSYKLLGKVLVSQEIQGREGEYEHRIMFVNIMNDDRESIIKYIFEEERRIRRREKGM